MRDRLCLIPYRDIILDKTYTNIGEYFLRGDSAIFRLLRAVGVSPDDRSDFELLSLFLKACNENFLCDSSVGRYFSKVVGKLIGEENVFEISAEELWIRTSDALLEDKNKLRATIASSGLESVGSSIEPYEEFDAHFARCGAVDISPVLCPFGTDNVSLDTIAKVKELSEVKNVFNTNMSRYDSVALFFNDFSFEIPNEYSASKAYEKYILGQTLSYKDADVLKSQLLRMALVSASENKKDVMMFLPLAPDVRSMGEVSALIDYIDESNIKINLTVYAGDAVGVCMAQAIAGNKYKNITAATGVSGNGSCETEKDIVSYWGAGELALERRASLAKTVAHLIAK